MAGRGLLPLLRLLLFVIALEASSSLSSYTSTHRRSLSSWSPSLHSRVNGSTIKHYKMKRELPDGSGDSGLPRFKNPPIVRSITANSAMVGLTPWTTQYYIGEMPDGSQPSFVLQFWEDGSRRLAQEYKTFAWTQRRNTHTFSGLTPDTMYTFSGIKANSIYTFFGLTPNTSYHVQALVNVTVGGKTCTADGKEVKAMNFTTICPDPPMPEGLSVTSSYSTRIAVQWSAGSYPQQCVLQYRLRVEKKRGNNRFIKDHVTEKVHDYITNLQPYTDYLVMVQSKSGRKYSAMTSTTVKTRPSKPGKVTGLRMVEANGTSLLVTWDHPQDNPPKGELESFKVSWRVIGMITGNSEERVGLQKRYLITNLNPGTTYTIKVQGKNKDVGGFGEPAEIIATTTTQAVPPKVVGLTNPNATVSWLTVSWETPETNTGITNFYNVKLRPAPAAASTNDSPQWNKTVHTTQAEFDGLEAGTKYTVQVRACNIQSCGDTLVGDVWTRPAPPRLLEEGVDLGEATGATMTIQLPLLANPPGWHYVMVQRQGTGVSSRNSEQELMNTARALVKEENNQTRQRRSVDSPIMYIAAKLQQEDDTRLQVTLGDNKTSDGRYYNQPLEKGATYWTLVVTEKRSGSWTEGLCSVPLRFVTAPNNTFEGLGLAAGMAAMSLVIAALAIVCIKKRHQLRVRLSRDRIVNMPRVPTRRGLAASMVAGGQAEDEDNYVDKPRIPTVLPRVALVHGQCRVVDEPGEDGNRTQPPRGAAVLRDKPPQQEPEYLYFGSEGEGGEPIYDDFDLPAPVHEEPINDDIDLPAPVHEEPIYDDIDLPTPVHEEPINDDIDLPTPVHEEPIYDDFDLPAPVHVYENVDRDDDYLTPRRLPPGTPSGVTEG